MKALILSLALCLITSVADAQWVPPEPAVPYQNPFSEYSPDNPFGYYGNPFSEYSNKNPFGGLWQSILGGLAEESVLEGAGAVGTAAAVCAV